MPRRRTGAVGALFAISVIVPTATAAQAQDVDLDCGHFTVQEDAQTILDADPSDPHLLDEDDNGVACEDLPRRGGPVTSSTFRPRTPTPTPAATRGVQGGMGGASGSGPTEWDIAIGLTFVTGAALATAYAIRRRRN